MHRTRFSQIGQRPLWAIAALQDNYIWAFAAPGDNHGCWIVDPGEAAPVRAWLQATGRQLRGILLTHHHPDHIGGLTGPDALSPVVLGPDDARMPAPRHIAHDGAHHALAPGLTLRVWAVPGHTSSHVAYVIDQADEPANAPWLFCGDTLFASGCGRIFDGSVEQLQVSIERIATLPDATLVCCAHEYTVANLHFALAVEPANSALHARLRQANALRAAGQITLPTQLGLEREVNPYLRLDQPAVAEALSRHWGRPLVGNAQKFAALRAWKDHFKG